MLLSRLTFACSLTRLLARPVQVMVRGEGLNVEAGCSALEIAASHGNAEMALLLLRHGASSPVDEWFEGLLVNTFKFEFGQIREPGRIPLPVAKLMRYLEGHLAMPSPPKVQKGRCLDALEQWAHGTVRDQRAMAAALFRRLDRDAYSNDDGQDGHGTEIDPGAASEQQRGDANEADWNRNGPEDEIMNMAREKGNSWSQIAAMLGHPAIPGRSEKSVRSPSTKLNLSVLFCVRCLSSCDLTNKSLFFSR